MRLVRTEICVFLQPADKQDKHLLVVGEANITPKLIFILEVFHVERKGLFIKLYRYI